ncbi:MAG: ECF-type sigma factor [Planctomycetota bacterium]|nr:ECF-type sigma factor [Planctomycetota bacterium]
MQESPHDSRRNDVAREVYALYLDRLKSVIRRLLSERVRRKEWTTVVAVEAIESFLLKSPDLDDPHGLWRILVGYARNKSLKAAHRFKTGRGTGGRETTATDLGASDAVTEFWENFEIGSEPDPSEPIRIVETLDRLTPEQRDLFLLLLTNHTPRQIGEKTNWGTRMTQRRIAELRKALEEFCVE